MKQVLTVILFYFSFLNSMNIADIPEKEKVELLYYIKSVEFGLFYFKTLERLKLHATAYPNYYMMQIKDIVKKYKIICPYKHYMDWLSEDKVDLIVSWIKRTKDSLKASEIYLDNNFEYDITSIDKVTLLKSLYQEAIDVFKTDSPLISKKECRNILKNESYILSINQKYLNVYLMDDKFNTHNYNMLNGPGAAQRAIEKARALDKEIAKKKERFREKIKKKADNRIFYYLCISNNKKLI